MLSRQDIKARAKQQFMNYYWPCVGVNVVISLILAALSPTVAGAIILAGPLMIGLGMFSILVYRGFQAPFSKPFDTAFDQNFGRRLGGYLWMQLFIFLWSLLFVIPGIIKSFSYAMTPYILADCPNVKAQDALKISMRMMNGHKGELFVFYLSFLGWLLLSGLTGGILSIFYVSPYMNTALAGYYQELKNFCLGNGVVAAAELA